MKVIGVGFGRTGTMSLKFALEELGFGPCYHMIEAMKHPSHAKLWVDFYDGELEDPEDILANYNSGCDWPIATFWKELLLRYPDAKIILTVRDPESWYQSFTATIAASTKGILLRIHRWLPTSLGAFLRMHDKVIWDAEFDYRLDDKEHCIKVFQDRIEEVKATVYPERLLVFEVKQGWGPLCQFLGVPIPKDNKPFPRVNDTEDFKKNFGGMRVFAWSIILLPVAATLATGLYVASRNHLITLPNLLPWKR